MNTNYLAQLYNNNLEIISSFNVHIPSNELLVRFIHIAEDMLRK